jgi:hypothetical protein
MRASAQAVYPTREGDALALARDELVQRAPAVRVCRTAVDARERNDAVVHDHADVVAGARTVQHYAARELGAEGRCGGERRTLELDVRTERCELADNEALVLRDVVGRERPAGGERAQVECGEHCARVSAAERGRER